MKHGLSMFLVMLTAVASRAADELPPAAQREISFSKDVRVIFGHRCASCHLNGKRKGGLDLSTREALLKGGESGPAAVPGKSAESRLIKLVAGLDPESKMPPKGEALTKDEISVLRAWIDQGLKWDAATVDRSQKVALALRKPAVPGGSGQPLDRLLAKYLAKTQQTEPKLCDDVAFARRASLDVTGLLPESEALAAFVADKSPGKRALWVTKLLENNQAYAEHWFSFWSDMLRNGTTLAGIDGHKNVNISPWLMKSLLANKPYDKLAAELISPTAETDAFIKGVVMRGVVPPSQIPEMQAAMNTAQVFLGVQLKCAACHDSFVSRFTLEEAYGMASIFSAKPLELVRCEIPQGKVAKARFLYPEVGTLNPDAPKAERLKRTAELITSPNNGQFARTIVNRFWGRLFGRAIVEPVDEMENAPFDADVLEFLAADFVEKKYDLKALLTTLMTSRAYQWQSADGKPEGKEALFRGPRVRRMTAEQFVDAARKLVQNKDRSFDDKPTPLLEVLGRPDRNTVTTTRDSDATTLQLLELINGPDLNKIIYDKAEARYAPLLLKCQNKRDGFVTELFSQALGRMPGTSEWASVRGAFGETLTPKDAADLVWTVVMLPEFQLIR